MDEVNLNYYITNYLKLRDKKAALVKEQKAKVKEYDDALETIEGALRQHLLSNNLQNIATKEGTAFLKRSRSATISDMDAFRTYVIENKQFDLASFRASPEAVENYVEEHDGKLPSGVNFNISVEVYVQKR